MERLWEPFGFPILCDVFPRKKKITFRAKYRTNRSATTKMTIVCVCRQLEQKKFHWRESASKAIAISFRCELLNICHTIAKSADDKPKWD